MYIIYQAKNKVNGKIYIGFTEVSLNSRKTGHKTDSKYNKHDIPFHNAIRKYGFSNFEWSILEQGEEDREYGLSRECFYIKEKQSHISSKGYNATLGGDGLSSRDPRVISKIKNSVDEYYSSDKFDRVKHSEQRGGTSVAVYEAICVQKSCGRPSPRKAIYEKGKLVKIFNTQIEACEEMKLSPSKVNLCINKKRPTHQGYIFERVECL